MLRTDISMQEAEDWANELTVQMAVQQQAAKASSPAVGEGEPRKVVLPGQGPASQT